MEPVKVRVKKRSPTMPMRFLNFIDLIQAPRPIPCGLSMGGAITQQLLLSHKDRFPAGILINTGARLKVLPLIFETIEKDYGDFVEMLFTFVISEKSSTEKLRAEIKACTICQSAVASGDFRACDGFQCNGQAWCDRGSGFGADRNR